ncbi:hypothetical protein [Hymenobacter sp. AT01-02]|uniref:hypothetical protein n=1 Tax=Hymenobacter sp. AT01-02 TaxID=1571877 RepID=UPI0006E350E9|nr:hypothetical protein [Hymenobacter sp. AT01-02]
MLRFTRLLISGLVFLLALAFSPTIVAQQKSGMPTAQRKLTAKVVRQARFRVDATPMFANINRIAYFHDKKALKAITKAEKRRNYPAARNLLEAYVSQFGIENFYKDTNLLWRLGQLWEKTGNEDRAKAYYRLALKHRRKI